MQMPGGNSITAFSRKDLNPFISSFFTFMGDNLLICDISFFPFSVENLFCFIRTIINFKTNNKKLPCCKGKNTRYGIILVA